MGGEIPSSYHMMGHQIVDPEKVQTVHLSRGSKLHLDYDVTEPGQVIK